MISYGVLGYHVQLFSKFELHRPKQLWNTFPPPLASTDESSLDFAELAIRHACFLDLLKELANLQVVFIIWIQLKFNCLPPYAPMNEIG